MPDHAAAHYGVIRDLLVNAGLPGAEVVQSLNDSWTRGHDEWVQLWDQQVAEDLRIEEEECQRLAEQEEQLRIQREQELENEK